jgi:branched-chain amino acid transport system permease protein
MDYLLHLAVLCAIYVVAAWSLDLLVGRLGVFNLAHGAFLGAGAYAYAIARTRFGISAIAAIGFAVVIAMAFGAAAATPAGRFKGEQAMLFTIAIQGLVTALLFNLEEVTGGAFGIVGIEPPIRLRGAGPGGYAFVAGAVLLLGLGFFSLLQRSTHGLVMRAVGENEFLAQSVGVNASVVRMWGFALAGATAGVAGALLAGYLTFIDPNSFNLDESIFLVTAVLVGGGGNLVGPALGMILILLLPEVLRGLAIPPSMVGNVRQIVFAILLIMLVHFRPRGLAGEAALR